MGIPVFLRMQIKFLYFLVFISLIQVFLFLDDDLGRFRYFPFFDCCPSPFLACSIHELSAWIKIPMCWFECLGLIHASTGNQEQSRISQFRRITENWRDYVSFFFLCGKHQIFLRIWEALFPCSDLWVASLLKYSFDLSVCKWKDASLTNHFFYLTWWISPNRDFERCLNCWRPESAN